MKLKCSIFFILPIILILFFSRCGMDNLPKGDFIESSVSPNKNYTVNAYLFGGNATTDYAIRCEVVYNSSGKTRNIYWNYHEDTVDMKWIDENTIDINNHRINVIDESYDFRDDL